MSERANESQSTKQFSSPKTFGVSINKLNDCNESVQMSNELPRGDEISQKRGQSCSTRINKPISDLLKARVNVNSINHASSTVPEIRKLDSSSISEERNRSSIGSRKRRLDFIHRDREQQNDINTPLESYEVNQKDQEQMKRKKKECFRCGGSNHIVLMCTSTERDAYNNFSLPKCEECSGRGHSINNCPSITNSNLCYKCGHSGHFSRDCPQNWGVQNLGSISYQKGESLRCSNSLMDDLSEQIYSYGYSSPEHFYTALNMASTSDMHSAHVFQQQVAGEIGQSLYSVDPNRYITWSGDNINGKQFYGTRRECKFQPGKCFRCGFAGHWTKDCPMRPADSDPNGCYKCGKLGHKSRECKSCYRCGEIGHRAYRCPHRRRM